jgi:hypothetical protein
MLRDWYWQLADAGKGPDWSLSLSVAPDGFRRLAALVRQHPLPGFSYHAVAGHPCRQHRHDADYDLYVDARNAESLMANITGGAQRNVWVYHAIEVCGADLLVERGYGGYPDAHGAAETGLIAMLAQDPDLALVAWRVSYGGEGYEGGDVATGDSAAGLLDYLRDPLVA